MIILSLRAYNIKPILRTEFLIYLFMQLSPVHAICFSLERRDSRTRHD